MSGSVPSDKATKPKTRLTAYVGRETSQPERRQGFILSNDDIHVSLWFKTIQMR